MSSQLYIRIFLAVFLVTASSVLLAGYLNYAKFEAAFSSVEASRYEFVTSDIVTSLESELDLGIAVSRMDSAERVLQQAMSRTAGMSGILVFDTAGAIPFRVGSVPLEDGVPAAWLDAVQASESGSFEASLEDTTVVGRILLNNFGQRVGGVAVAYSSLERQIVIIRMVMSLFIGAMLISVAVVLISSFGLRWLTGGVTGRVQAISQALGRSTSSTAAAPPGATSDQDGESQTRVASADSEMAEVLRELEDLERALAGRAGRG